MYAARRDAYWKCILKLHLRSCISRIYLLWSVWLSVYKSEGSRENCVYSMCRHKVSDQLAHMRRLIRVFAVCWLIKYRFIWDSCESVVTKFTLKYEFVQICVNLSTGWWFCRTSRLIWISIFFTTGYYILVWKAFQTLKRLFSWFWIDTIFGVPKKTTKI